MVEFSMKLGDLTPDERAETLTKAAMLRTITGGSGEREAPHEHHAFWHRGSPVMYPPEFIIRRGDAIGPSDKVSAIRYQTLLDRGYAQLRQHYDPHRHPPVVTICSITKIGRELLNLAENIKRDEGIAP